MTSQAATGFKWDRPIIIIGGGRTGSTLLSTVIGDHSEVYAADETSFLLNRLWDEYFARPDYVMNYRTWRLIQKTRPDWQDMPWYKFGTGPLREQLAGPGAALADNIRASEEKRLSRCLGRFIAESLVPPALRYRFWSFKEIWNGSPSFPYGWERHDMAFPDARYVHVVRHPWTWARSYFLNMNVVPSKRDFHSALQHWVSMVETACLQEKHCGRYILVRYEDFTVDVADTIRTVLSFLELEDEPRCHATADYKYLSSKGTLSLPWLSDKDVEGVPRLLPLMGRFGYTPQTFTKVQNGRSDKTRSAFRVWSKLGGFRPKHRRFPHRKR